MQYLFFVLFVILFLINRNMTKSIVNSFNIIFTPYVFIIFINNTFLSNRFYSVTDRVIWIMIAGMAIYELVFLIFNITHQANKNKVLLIGHQTIIDYSGVNYKFIEWFCVIVVSIRLVTLIYLYVSGGIAAISGNDFMNLQVGMIMGRLVLMLYPAGWLLALRLFRDNTLKARKKVIYSILCIACLILQYMSEVRAHAMIFLVGVFFIAVYCNIKNFFRGLLIVVGLIILMFFGTYALSWVIIDGSIPSMEYTLSHFWKYLAGGTINIEGQIASGTTTYNFFDYWITVLSPIPNEFLQVFGVKISPEGSIPYINAFPRVSAYYVYETSNVTSLFGRFYGCGGLNIIGYFLNVIIFACISEWSTIKFRYSKKLSYYLVGLVFLTYELVSFFAFYYGTSHFWQILIYSLLFSYISKIKWTKSI